MPTRRRPTSPLFPYTTLFRSNLRLVDSLPVAARMPDGNRQPLSAVRRLDPIAVPPVVRRRTALNRSEDHTSELQSRENIVCLLLVEKNILLERTNSGRHDAR